MNACESVDAGRSQQRSAPELTELRSIRACARCRQEYSEMDNVKLPCSYHPGRMIKFSGYDGVGVFDCCCGLCDRNSGFSSPGCTACSHTELLGENPELSLLPVTEEAARELGITARPAASSTCAAIRDASATISTVFDHPRELRLADCVNAAAKKFLQRASMSESADDAERVTASIARPGRGTVFLFPCVADALPLCVMQRNVAFFASVYSEDGRARKLLDALEETRRNPLLRNMLLGRLA